ncbi:MAG TPA: hypothetical protein VGH44_03760 [Candidatus Saccharimonadia bacterium]|jgi:hypothetical protein
MRRRNWFAFAGSLGLVLAICLTSMQTAQAGGVGCGPGQGSYTLVDDYGIAVSGVANGFSYQESPRSVSLHMDHPVLVMKAFARYDGPSWQIGFKRQNDGSLTAHSTKPFISVLLCLYPNLTDGHPQTVYPTADAHGDALATNNNVVAVGNTNDQTSTTIQVSNQAAGSYAQPSSAETAPAAHSSSFTWHALESVVGWVTRLLWIISAIMGLIASRRRSRNQSEQ